MIDAYGRVNDARQELRHDDILGPIVDRFHEVLVRLVQDGDAFKLAQYLTVTGRTDAGHGFYQGKAAFDQIVGNKDYSTADLLRHLECLVRLGEAVGCLDVLKRNPRDRDPRLANGVEHLIERIGSEIGIDIVPPTNLGGLCGIVTERGILHMRHLNALYAAWRLKTVHVHQRSGRQPAVCEIGAGAGLVAYYCSKLGVEDYTIIDLRNLNIVQGYFLKCALDPEKISLYEDEKLFIDQSKIRVLPDFCFRDIPDDYFDYLVNQDSFPEIHPDVIREYFQYAKRNTKRFVFSFNQEYMGARHEKRSRRALFQIASEMGGFSRVYRFPYWMRAGYVEELWQIL